MCIRDRIQFLARAQECFDGATMAEGMEFLDFFGRASESGAIQEMRGGLRGPFRVGQGIQHRNQTLQIAESFQFFLAAPGIAKASANP